MDGEARSGLASRVRNGTVTCPEEVLTDIRYPTLDEYGTEDLKRVQANYDEAIADLF